MNINDIHAGKKGGGRAAALLAALLTALLSAACQSAAPAPAPQPGQGAPGAAAQGAQAAPVPGAPGEMRVYRQRGEVPVDVVHAMRKDDFSPADRTGLTLVYFSKAVCAACARQAPAWDLFQGDLPAGVNAKKVLEHEVDLDWYDIASHPTFILFRDGREAWRFVGVATVEQLRNGVNRHLRR